MNAGPRRSRRVTRTRATPKLTTKAASKLALARPTLSRCPRNPPDISMTNVFTRTVEIIIAEDTIAPEPAPRGLMPSWASQPCVYMTGLNQFDHQGVVNFTMSELLFCLTTRLVCDKPLTYPMAIPYFSLLKLDKVSAWGPTSTGFYGGSENPWALDTEKFWISGPLNLTVYNYVGCQNILNNCSSCPVYYQKGIFSAVSDGSPNKRAAVAISNPGAEYSLIPIEFPSEPEYFEDPIWISLEFPGLHYYYAPSKGIIWAVLHVTLTGEMCRDTRNWTTA